LVMPKMGFGRDVYLKKLVFYLTIVNWPSS
jgi:hypothetical protein